MTPDETNNLRKTVKKLLVDLNLDKNGNICALATDLTERMGRNISRNTLTMALSGYRATKPYQEILAEMASMLSERVHPTVTPYTVRTLKNN